MPEKESAMPPSVRAESLPGDRKPSIQERPPLSEARKRENERQRKMHETLAAMGELDRRFVELLSADEVEIWVKTQEALTASRELRRQALGGDERGINATERRTYAGPPPLVGFAKPQAAGEAVMAIDPGTNELVRVSRIWHPDEKIMAVVFGRYGAAGIQAEELVRMQAQAVRKLQGEWPEYRKRMARLYGLEPEDIGSDGSQFAMRKGVEVGTSGVREAAVSRLDRLLDFDVVPLTVLRAERERLPRTDGSDELPVETDPGSPVIDVASVQQEAHGVSAARLSYAEYAQALENPEGRKSFIRIAVLDYLVKSHDRHYNNIIFDGMRFRAIDNGLSFGLSQDVSSAAGSVQAESLDPYVSAPMLEMQKHGDWRLDQEALDKLRRILEDLTASQQRMKGGPDAEAGKNSKTFEYVQGLFGVMFSHRNIAATELGLFIERLKTIVDNDGRIPTLASDKLTGKVKRRPEFTIKR